MTVGVERARLRVRATQGRGGGGGFTSMMVDLASILPDTVERFYGWCRGRKDPQGISRYPWTQRNPGGLVGIVGNPGVFLHSLQFPFAERQGPGKPGKVIPGLQEISEF
eukprot:1124745-Amorphochlora_amoeboformis.AAC.1